MINGTDQQAKQDVVWQQASLTQTYLEGVRGAIPLAAEQIAIMLRLIRATDHPIHTVLDLGCGDGILGQAVLDQHPNAAGVFADFSPPMLIAARQRLSGYLNAHFVLSDYGQTGWQDEVLAPLGGTDSRRFDVIVSGFSIHHQPDGRKWQLYKELYSLLNPGGLFLNLEHVSSPTPWLERQFEQHFIDSLVAYHHAAGSGKIREQIDHEFYSRPDKQANILAPVELQLAWLRDIGFQDVDCYLKIFELALFGGRKPKL
jgi:SAM-dependent methyltransferase